MFPAFLLVLIVCSRLSIISAEEDDGKLSFDFSVDRSNYIDPHDMFNYDRRALRKEKQIEPGGSDLLNSLSSETTEDILDEVTEKFEAQDILKLKQEPSDIKKSDSSTCKENPFLGRFARILSNTLQLEVGCNL